MDLFQHALEVAYRYLGHRDRSVAEVRTRLEREEVAASTIDAAVEELGRLGYLDDARHARCFAEDRRKLDRWGAERIERRLLEAGIAREHIAAALAGQDRESELDAAVAVLRRRFPAPPQTDRERERALGLLVRKGYELELAYDAVRALGREP